MNLLMVAHNYLSQNKKVIVIKPKIDNRFGENMVASRTGFKRKADFIIEKKDNLLNFKIEWDNIDCLLVDEANLLSEKHINQLRTLTAFVPVICYGLRTDYKTRLFHRVKRLMEIADSIEEIKTTCMFCNNKAIINYKHQNGNIVKEGSSDIDIGAEDKYGCICWDCWKNN